jgi:uncharacterized phage-associated protein
MVSAQDVADYIIWSSHEAGSFISNLKLQKLLYYVQAWHLAVFQRPLFPEKFRAWIRGPAIPEIYERYKGYGWRNIDEEVKPPDLEPRMVEFLEEVLKEYGALDARYLEQLACHEDLWLAARGDIPIDEPSTATIDEETMGVYYRYRLSGAELRDMLRQYEATESGGVAAVSEGLNYNPATGEALRTFRDQARTGRTAG